METTVKANAECGITAELGRRPALRGGGGQTGSNQTPKIEEDDDDDDEDGTLARQGVVKAGQTKMV